MLKLRAHPGTEKAMKGQLCSVLEFLRELWGSTSVIMEKVFSKALVKPDAFGAVVVFSGVVAAESLCATVVESVSCAFA
ncbi:MAG: hypothetical protein IJ909_02390 [Fibrobacter sp.]|nr:hypothetical protein [Fibrobacter sp.]